MSGTGRWPVVAAALFSALAVFVVWGATLDPGPVMHDEWAYWLQADQYAHLKWKAAAPGVPEFFEQFYVLVTPVFAAKYPPGHALAIAPGFVLGLPGLVPLALTGVTGALVFALARRLAGASTALLTWALWLGTFGNLRFRAAYFSELTTSFCWLVAWWALLEWRAADARRRTRWMVLLAVAIGWGALTRPATMFVFAVPVGVVVLRDTVRTRRWRDLAAGVGAGALVLSVLPLWSVRVTGDWRTSPLAMYTRQYLPFDTPGYVVNATPPERALPAEMERTRTFLRDIKGEQARAPVWKTASDRAWFLLGDTFGGWRLPFALAFAVGAATAGAAAWFALGTGALLIAAYLAQAHTADWTVYYLEAMPVLAFTAALGVARVRSRAGAAAAPRWLPLAAVVVGALLVRDVLGARAVLGRIAAEPRAFRAAVARLPKRPNVVFVRYAERRSMHIALVANRGLPDRAPSWIVHDRGADDGRLRAAAPARAAYLFDEATGEFREMKP
ncbi:MAG TPA: glycosyltransferase family 39 protein [Gemmatimonadaceae bacterium]|nr:glycosyltransferase family 39 protein [Gemmatimonadaceae bacterium]